MIQARYIGPSSDLQGRKALIRLSANGDTVMAQFDSRAAFHNGKCLAFNWHAFEISDFALVHPDGDSHLRDYFEKGCVCIKNGVLKPAAARACNDLAGAYYMARCQCSRHPNYRHPR